MSKIHELAFNAEEIDELLDSVDKKTIYQDATQSEHGLMSTTDKTKLDALPTAQQIDGALNAKVDKEVGKGLSKNDYTDAEKESVASAYHKPQNGIPESDLDSSVQTSLNKADTALQSFTETDPTVPSWAKQSTKPSYDYSEIGNTPDLSGFITKSVNDLTNYYLKSEIYTKTEVQELINAVKQFTYESVASLPTASSDTMHKIYLVPSADPQTSNVKDEYITIESSGSYSWEQIGSTAIDLSGYVTTSALNTALSDYTTTASLTVLLSNKADKVSEATSGNLAGLDANGNLTDSGKKTSDFATASQGAKADTAYQKPQTGIPETDLSSDVQSHLNKHFKGWYASPSALPANPVVGDYAYVKGAEITDPAAIYECTTNGSWSDSGRTADTFNVQTFESGQEVNETYIDDTHLVNPKDGALPKAEDVMQLNQKLRNISFEDIKIDLITSGENQNYFLHFGVKSTGIASLSDSNNNAILLVDVHDCAKLRFAGWSSSGATPYGVGFCINKPTIENGATVDEFIQFETYNGGTSTQKEYIINISDGMNWAVVTHHSSVVTNFYCYKENGVTVEECFKDVTKNYTAISVISGYIAAAWGQLKESVNIPNGCCVKNIGSKPIRLYDANNSYIAVAPNSVKVTTKDYNTVTSTVAENDVRLLVYLDKSMVVDDNNIPLSQSISVIKTVNGLNIQNTTYPARSPYSLTTAGYFLGYNVDLTGIYDKGYRGVVFQGTTYQQTSDIKAGVILDENNNVLRSVISPTNKTTSWHVLEIDSQSKTLWATVSRDATDGGPIFTPEQVHFVDEKTWQLLNLNINELSTKVATIEEQHFPETYLPSKIYGVIGDTMQLFIRGIVYAVDPYRYSSKFKCSDGRVYTRYLEITPQLSNGVVPTGRKIKHHLIDDYYNESIDKSSEFILSARPTISPQNNINVLCCGASTTVNGEWAGELKRRLTGTVNTGSPSADGLTNITFVGRKNGQVDTNVKVEGDGGWTWRQFYTPEDSIRFQVTDFNSAELDAIYSYKDSNNVSVRIKLEEINVTGSSGNLRFTFTTDNHNLPASSSGNLTKYSGSGDATIAYTSHSNVENYAPFYDTSTGEPDFAKYAQDYCNGQIDVVIFDMSSVNANVYYNPNVTIPQALSQAMNQMKTLLNALHADFPNCKVIVSAGAVLDTHNGTEYNYGSSSSLTTWSATRGKMLYAKKIEETIAEDDYKDWCFLADTLAEIDAEYTYPTETKAVNTRVTDKTEIIGINGQHPLASGQYMKADSIYRCFVNTILGA